MNGADKQTWLDLVRLIKKFTFTAAECPVETRWDLVNSEKVALELGNMEDLLKSGSSNGHSSLASDWKDSAITNLYTSDNCCWPIVVK